MLFLAISITILPVRSQAEGGWVEFLDVGHGDAAVICSPEHKIMLVDGGGVINREELITQKVWLPYLKHRNIQSIDVLVISHPHPDHYLGFVHLIDEISVREIWHPGTPGSKSFEAFLLHAKNIGIHVRSLSDLGKERELGSLHIRFLHPKKVQNRRVFGAEMNNQSLVMEVEMHQRRFLFTGDIEQRAEQSIIGSNPDRYSFGLDVLKVPHHGSRSSSTFEFLNWTHTHYAVISAGRLGRHVFPHSEVTQRFDRLTIPTFTTRTCGAIRARVVPHQEIRWEFFRPECQKFESVKNSFFN